jgi:hypothetical protein
MTVHAMLTMPFLLLQGESWVLLADQWAQK